MGKYCSECEKQGVLRMADRIMPGGQDLCDHHWRKADGVPPAPSTMPLKRAWECEPCLEQGTHTPAELVMNGMRMCRAHSKSAALSEDDPPQEINPADVEVREKTKMPMDYAAMQKDRDGGMSVTEICKKYDCSNPSVYNNTKARKGVVPKVAPLPKPRRSIPMFDKTANGFAGTITDLQRKREEYSEKILKIDAVIASLEEL